MVILGLGHTGLELAKLARAFGMRVVGVRRSTRPCPQVDELHGPGRLEGLWSRAEVLSVNLPLNESTRHFVGREVLDQLPVGAVLLNGSRGAVVKAPDLENALYSGRLGGAWLDVTDPEPLPPTSPLWEHPRVVVTPHCADQVTDFPLRYARFFVENLRRFEKGEALENVVSRS